MTSIANAYEFHPKSGGAPKQVVLLLHGLGSDGRDLIGLAPEFAKVLPDAVFVSPDAPFRCDMAPMGYQWFSLQSWGYDSMLNGIRTAAPILRKFMDEQLKKYKLPASKLALAGFSQGSMMSLYTGPRYPDAIAGVLGYSGALVGAESPAEIKHKVPVCLIHGEADMVVPVTAYHFARQQLENLGFPVSGHTTPFLPHGIDGGGISAGAAFLQEVLG